MTRLPRHPRLYLIVTVVSVLFTLYSGFELLGTPLRRVHVLTLFAGGMVSGVSLVQAIVAWRASRAKPPANV